MSRLREEAVLLDKDLVARKKSGEEVAAKVAQLESARNEAYQLKVDLSAAEKSNEELKVTSEDARKKLTDLNVQLEKFEGQDFDRAKFEALTAKVAQLESLQQQADRLKGGLARLPVAEKVLAETGQKLDDSRERLLEYQNELKDLGVSETEISKAAERFNAARNKFDTLKGELLAKAKEKELLEKELEGKAEQLKSFDKAAAELEQSRSAHYYGEKLGRLFSDFRQNLIATIRPSLSEISSRLFSDMTDGKYTLVDLDEKYNLRVMDSGTYYGVDRFSGGEKDLANLSLRLAISLALTESAGLQRSFVILDEVFGSQDAQRKELILQAMAQLKNRFPQILLITHIDDVKDGVEEIIEVLPTGSGWSEVRVNGTGV
jgi:exonuclease SbcC